MTPETKRNREQAAQEKLSRIPIKIIPGEKVSPKKPEWLKIRLPAHASPIHQLKRKFRDSGLATVCEEASCPNLAECFSHGIATFMIMGRHCTRRCSFCDVEHGRPQPLDPKEPEALANTIADMELNYVVITSVDRDDLKDGGAGHFRDCIIKVREKCPGIKIEILVPDFRGRMEKAIEILCESPPEVFNHNLETVPRLYLEARPGSDYQASLNLLKAFYDRFPHIPTKSGLMLGLGETIEEIELVLADLRAHKVSMLTLGQYLQPTQYHLPVHEYIHPNEFERLGNLAKSMGFSRVASGPFVRSSYHADKQAKGETVS